MVLGAQGVDEISQRLEELALGRPSAGPAELHAALQKEDAFRDVGFMKAKRLLQQIRRKTSVNFKPSSSKDGNTLKNVETKQSVKRTFTNLTLERNLDPSKFVGKITGRQPIPLSDPNFMKRKHYEQALLNAEKPPTLWAFDWNCATGGTANPSPQVGHASFFTNEFSVPPGCKTVDHVDLQRIAVVQILATFGWHLALTTHDTRRWESMLFPPVYLLDDQQPFLLQKAGAKNMVGRFTILHRNYMRECTEQVLLGLNGSSIGLVIGKEEDETFESESGMSDEEHPELVRRRHERDFYGPLIRIDSFCEDGFDALRFLAGLEGSKRSTAFLPHVQETLEQRESYQVVASTGRACHSESSTPMAIISGASKDRSKRGIKEHLHESFVGADDVSTLFTWFENDVPVAKCLVTYQNEEEQQPGPCIEKLATKQNRRGEDILAKLYNVVENFLLKKWRLMGRTPAGRRYRIYAPHLKNTEVEQVKKSHAEGPFTITDKDFFFRYQGFQTLLCETTAALSFIRRPVDEDAVKYIKHSVAKQFSDDIDEIGMRKCKGVVHCQLCNAEETAGRVFQKCSGCSAARYCSIECQKNDWNKHKLWCGKSEQAVRNQWAGASFAPLE